MHLDQLFIPTAKKPAEAPVVRKPVAQEDEETIFGDAISVTGRERFKRELAMLKDSNPALYDKIVNMK